MPSNKSKKVNTNSNKLTSKKSKLPTSEECGGFKYHYPWSKSKYKEACQKKNCFFNYKVSSLMGSYCEDAITVTNRNIHREHLEDIFKLCGLTITELKSILTKCNMADTKYLNECLEIYKKKRYEALTNIVVECQDNLVRKLSDKLIDKFIKNAKQAGIKNIKDIYEIKYKRFLSRRLCFNTKLGNSPRNYKMKTWSEISKILDDCGVPMDSIFYEQARVHFEIYSRNSPFYHIQEMPVNDSEYKSCQTDYDCSGNKLCMLGECIEDTTFHIVYNRTKPIDTIDDLPAGTWKETAKDIRVYKNILMAKLKKLDGSYSYDRVVFNPNDSFSNMNGTFKLDYLRTLPGGTWRETAKNIEIKMGILSALLKDKDGNYRHDYIIYNSDMCLENKNGKFEVVIC